MSREINIMVSVAPENGLQTTIILCKGIKFYDIVNSEDLKLWVKDPPRTDDSEVIHVESSGTCQLVRSWTLLSGFGLGYGTIANFKFAWLFHRIGILQEIVSNRNRAELVIVSNTKLFSSIRFQISQISENVALNWFKLCLSDRYFSFARSLFSYVNKNSC